MYNNSRFIDPYWGFNPIFMIILTVSYLDFKGTIIFGNTNINEKTIVFAIFSLLLVYGIRHVIIYSRAFKSLSLEDEDFRYVDFRVKFGTKKVLYWIFNYVFLHIYSIFIESSLLYPPIHVIEIFTTFSKESENRYRQSFKLCYLGYFLSIIGFILETLADEQLYYFMIKKENSESKHYNSSVHKDHLVIKAGLWSKIRHPNYLGEIIYMLGLLVINYGVTEKLDITMVLPLIAYFIMFVSYSIPMMEDRLMKKYRNEYTEYKKNTYRLIPYIY